MSTFSSAARCALFFIPVIAAVISGKIFGALPHGDAGSITNIVELAVIALVITACGVLPYRFGDKVLYGFAAVVTVAVPVIYALRVPRVEIPGGDLTILLLPLAIFLIFAAYFFVPSRGGSGQAGR